MVVDAIEFNPARGGRADRRAHSIFEYGRYRYRDNN
jgi:hypothetical protein